MSSRNSSKHALLHFHDEGQGKIIVLLHGFLESHSIWKHFSKELAKEYRIISIDLPGHGRSHGTADILSMEEAAKEVHAVLEEAGVENCFMVGHSMGGYVTLAFAELFPHMLKGICLFHSTASADSEEKKAGRNRSIEAVRKNHTTFISNLIPSLFAEQNREKLHSEIEDLKKLAQKTSAHSITAALGGMRDRKDRTSLLKSFRFPVLYIPGRHDIVIPVDSLIAQAGLPKNALTLVLEDSGHMGFIEEPEESLVIVQNFARSCFSR